MKIIQLRSRLWRWAGLALLAGLSGTTMVLIAAYLYLAPQLPPASALREVQYQIPLRVYSRDGEMLAEFGEKRRSPVNYDQLPQPFVQAVLAAEDERFFRHGGVDMRGLLRAALELLWYQDIRSGGSTITMQVARNFFLDREQKFLRKFNEIVLALEIENLISKEEILALYLNKIYLGHRAYGAEAAAQVYYGKAIDQLSLAQWAMIAGLPKAPSAYNPVTNPSRAMTRRNWILSRMLNIGHITEEQYQEAISEPNTAELHGPRPDVEAAYLAEMVRRDLVARYGAEEAYTRGLNVYTTLDSQLQRAAVDALRLGLHEYDERHGWRGPVTTIELPEDLPDWQLLPVLAGSHTETEPDNQGLDTTEANETGSAAETQTIDMTTLEGATELTADGSAVALTEVELATLEEQRLAQEQLEAERLEAIRQARDSWRELLKPHTPIADLKVAVVVNADELAATLVTRDGEQLKLPLDAISWAAPFVSRESIGSPPEQVTEVINVGDVIMLRKFQSEEQSGIWRLAQQPEVQSALVSMDPSNGAIRALVGGYSFAGSNFNRVIQGERQAGSSFKPFIYTSGLLAGLTTATLINDAPIVFEDSELETAWRPTGAGSRFYGPTRLREALYRSLNLVSIRLLKQIGIGTAISTLRDFGLPVQRFPRDLSLSLGSAAITPLELATAYTAFANGGFVVDSWFVDRIESNEGEVLWQAPQVVLCAEPPCEEERPELDEAVADMPDLPEAGPVIPEPVIYQRAIDARAVWLMNSMLKDVVARGTARRASQLGRSDLAGKTGTTNEQVDAWFSGYSPALVATVWVGFDDPATLGRGEYGGRAALPIWMAYMDKALAGTPNQELPQPEGIVTVRINPETGKQARPGDAAGIFEYFREENVPDQDTSPEPITNDDGTTPEQLF